MPRRSGFLEIGYQWPDRVRAWNQCNEAKGGREVKVLVTGASGRVGANLTKKLIEEGHTVRAFVFPGDESRMHKLDGYDVETQYGDVRNYDDVVKAVLGMDAVYHIAAAMIGPFQNVDYFDINAKGTFHVVEAVRQNCPNLHRLIYAGTDATYPTFPDTGPEQAATEDVHVEPTGLYALSKWMGERLVLNHYRQYGTPSVIFRFAWVMGAGEILDPNYARMYWLSKVRDQANAQRGKSAEADAIADQLDALWPGEERMLVTYSSSGKSNSMYFVDVRDLLQGLLLGLNRPEAVGEVFNLPGQRRWLHSEVVPYISERIGVPYVERHLSTPAKYRGLSREKAGRVLGYEPEHDLASMVDLGLAMQRGEEIDLIATGVPYGSAKEA